jgi:hypothetical protein
MRPCQSQGELPMTSELILVVGMCVTIAAAVFVPFWVIR